MESTKHSPLTRRAVFGLLVASALLWINCGSDPTEEPTTDTGGASDTSAVSDLADAAMDSGAEPTVDVSSDAAVDSAPEDALPEDTQAEDTQAEDTQAEDVQTEDAQTEDTQVDLFELTPVVTVFDDPLIDLPSTLSEVGLYPEAPDLSVIPESAVVYAPIWPLWTNGSVKWRYLVLPEGQQVDNSADVWAFPTGTLFFKTFLYPDGDGGLNPLETRMIRRFEDGWEFSVYLWNDEGTDAVLVPANRAPPSVEVTVGDDTFEHQIPAILDCRTCHESNPAPIIGFDELQLNGPLEEGGPSQLEAFFSGGILSTELTEDPAFVDGRTELETEVFGYVHGNCAHCHNDTENAQSPLDLRHSHMLESTFNQGSRLGVLIQPDSPENSVVFQRLSQESDDVELTQMPPIGVDLLDLAAIEDMRAWIGEVRPPAFDLALEFEEIAIAEAPGQVTVLRFLPESEDELFLVTQPGTIHHYELIEDTMTLLGSFEVPDVFNSTDCGVISMAFHPDFAENQQVFAGHCTDANTNRVVRFSFDPESYETIGDSVVTVLELGDPGAPEEWHNVGSIGFEEDGTMWVLFGDKNRGENGQDTTNNLGALLRVVPNLGEPGYTAAEGNLFDGMGDDSPDIFAYGLRSPWKGFLDSAGRYWIGDVGSNRFEEINLVTEEGSRNLGWALVEGTHCFDPEDCPDSLPPLTGYDRSGAHPFVFDDPETVATQLRAIWLGLEYIAPPEHDPYAGELDGIVTYGDFCTGWFRGIRVDEEGRVIREGHLGHIENVTSQVIGPDGYIYLTTYGSCSSLPTPTDPSQLYRVVLSEE